MNNERKTQKSKKEVAKDNYNVKNEEIKNEAAIDADIDNEADTDTVHNTEQEPADPLSVMTEKYLRTLAEFDNYRKRTDKEKSSMYSEGAKLVISTLLPVLDNFERALKSQNDTTNQFYSGVEMIYKQMKTTFETLGLIEIETTGNPFDSNLHEAVMHVEDEAYGANEIIEELQKGYMYKDKVVRHSLVKVAN